jgi:DUF1009 family protein
MKTIEVSVLQTRINKKVVEDFGTMVQKFYVIRVDNSYNQLFEEDEFDIEEIDAFGDFYKLIAEVNVTRPYIMAGDYQKEILPELKRIAEEELFKNGIYTIHNKKL